MFSSVRYQESLMWLKISEILQFMVIFYTCIPLSQSFKTFKTFWILCVLWNANFRSEWQKITILANPASFIIFDIENNSNISFYQKILWNEKKYCIKFFGLLDVNIMHLCVITFIYLLLWGFFITILICICLLFLCFLYIHTPIMINYLILNILHWLKKNVFHQIYSS